MFGTVKSLKIIQNHDVRSPKQFASLYFGRDHPGWKRSGPCGRNKSGIQKGQGLMLWAGGWLGKLSKKGLIHHSVSRRTYRLTSAGTELLERESEVMETIIDKMSHIWLFQGRDWLSAVEIGREVFGYEKGNARGRQACKAAVADGVLEPGENGLFRLAPDLVRVGESAQ